MTQSEITAFLAIIQCGSFSSAAEHLYITQPALSRRIQALEKKVGYKLFERSRGFRNAALTEQGRVFVGIAEKMLDLLSETENIKSLSSSESLSITCIGSVNGIIMPDIYKQFIEKYDGVKLSISSQHSEQGYEYISKDKTDIGFIATDMYYKNVETRPFYKEKFVLICSENTKIKSSHPTSLDPGKEIFYQWSSEYSMWHSYWYGSETEPIAKMDGIMALDSVISIEGTWAVVPYSVAEKIKKASPISIYDISDGPSERIIYYIVKPGRRKAVINEFLNTAVECLNNIPYLTVIF